MKKLVLFIALVTVCNTFGAIVYNDNQEHIIDFSTDEIVSVRNETTVIVTDDAFCRLWLSGHSTANIEGGIITGLATEHTSTVYINGGDFD